MSNQAILFIGRDSGTSRHRAGASAFRRLGYYVFVIDPFSFFPNNRFSPFLEDFVRRSVLTNLPHKKFDLVYVDGAELIGTSLLLDWLPLVGLPRRPPVSVGLTASQCNKSFETLREALAGLKAKNAILDGEIVCLDSEGCSQFKELLYRRGRAVFFAFDLVWLDGVDLRQMPLIERKKKLKGLIERSECSEILYAQHIERNGKLLFEEVCERNLEGVVAKRRMGRYAEHGWLKIKNSCKA